MYFLLFLTFEGIEFDSYGPFVDDPENDFRVNYFPLNNSEEKYFENDVMDIDEKCNAILDCGDVDYFDFHQCEKLIVWIEERLQKPIVPRYREILEVLRDFCCRAAKLSTWAVIEL